MNSDKKRKRKLPKTEESESTSVDVEKEKIRRHDGLEFFKEETVDYYQQPQSPVADQQQDDSFHCKEQFSVKSFREKLRSDQFIEGIRHFLDRAAKQPKIVGQYIKCGGKPLELTQTLERVDKTNLSHIAYILHAIQLSIVELLSTAPQHQPAAVQSCSYLMNSHRSCIEKLLNSTDLNHKKIVFKLLTVTVTMEPTFGRDVLSLFNTETLWKFTEHSRTEMMEDETVRKYFIDLLMGFMAQGNVILIQNLLDRAELLTTLFDGLIYDSESTVRFVLETFQTFVLNTTVISKTRKVQIFNVNFIKHLTTLYEWVGPGKPDDICLESRATISKLLTDLLIGLLASRKYGVAFKCLGKRVTGNKIQNVFLKTFDNSMFDGERCRLLIAIVHACPELIRVVTRNTSNNFDSKYKIRWPAALKFLIDLIDHLTPDSTIVKQIKQIDCKEMIELFKSICFPIDVLLKIRSKNMIQREDRLVRHLSMKLLYKMFDSSSRFMTAIIKSNRYDDLELKKLKFAIINHVFVCCPTVERILTSLNRTITNLESDEFIEQMELNFDLLLTIARCVPSFIEKTSSIIGYLSILQPIYDLNRSEVTTNQIELKAVKLILTLEPKAITPITEYFHQIMTSFLNVYYHGTVDQQIEAKHLLQNVLQMTGIFINGRLEIDLWLLAFKMLGFDTDWETVRDEFVQLIKEVATTGVDNDNKLIEIGTTSTNWEECFENIDKSMTINGIIDIPRLNNGFYLTISSMKHSKPFKHYLDCVSGLLFFYIPEPSSLHLIEQLQRKDSKYKKSMNDILNGRKPLNSLSFPSNELSEKLIESIFNKKFLFNEIFGKSSSQFDCLIDGQTVKLNETLRNDNEIMFYIYICLFIVEQSNMNDKFSVEIGQVIIDYLKRFLTILYHTSDSIEMSGFETNQNDVIGTSETNYRLALRYIFCNRNFLLEKFNIWSTDEMDITGFIYQLICFVKNFEQPSIDWFDKLLYIFRRKAVNQIRIEALNGGPAPINEKTNVLNILEMLSIDSENCLDLIKTLSKLETSTYCNGSIFIDLLAFSINRIADLKSSEIELTLIKKLLKLFVKLQVNSNDLTFERLEMSFIAYFKVYYQSIGAMPTEFFETIVQLKKLTKPSIQLAGLLFERNNELNDFFMNKILTKHLQRKELIYPLLNIFIQKEGVVMETNVLNEIFNEYKNGIFKTIEKPQKAAMIYRENVECSIYLIQHFMPLKECVDFTKKSFKFDSCEIYQLKLINAIYWKALKSPDSTEIVFINFIQLFLQLFTVALKKGQIGTEKIASLSLIIYDWLNGRKFNDKLTELSFDTVTKSQQWLTFTKNCLKFGIQLGLRSEDGAEPNGYLYLKLIGYLTDQFYTDGCKADEPKQFFEMAISHSQFFELASNQQPIESKTYLMYILNVFLRKNSTPMESVHIPIFLGAYQARLSACDRYILSILQQYERNGISLHDYQPLLWGETAINHYSLRSDHLPNENRLKLNWESPMNQVMSIIDQDVTELTLRHYPVWRRLNVIDQLPDIIFDRADAKWGPKWITNRIERIVECDEIELKRDLLLIPSNSERNLCEIYDPAFFVPIMCLAFSSEHFTRPIRPAQNGLLAMTMAGLSSLDKEMRLASGTAMHRYRSHMGAAKFLDNKLWCHLFDSIQGGLAAMCHDVKQQKKNKIPRVPYVAGLMTAQIMNILVNPLNELYRHLSTFLLVQNAFNFRTVPEFNVLFQSPDVNHITLRHFVLEVIKYGLKCSNDCSTLISSNIFKSLLGFYGTPMSTRDTNLSILTVINAAIRIPNSIKQLIDIIGILPWLSYTIDNLEFFQFEFIDGMCGILNNLWYSVKIMEIEWDRDRIVDIESRILNICFKVIPKLSTRTTQRDFARFINVFSKCLNGKEALLLDEDLKHLLNCSDGWMKGKDCRLRFIKDNGTRFIESESTYVRNLYEQDLDRTLVFVCSTLRNIIIRWTNQREKCSSLALYCQ